MERELQTIAKKVHALQADKEKRAAGKLPSNAFFLNADEIVCFPRAFGDSRYPYAFDGLTLWAHASGNIKIEESAFNILLDWENTGEPNLAFFFGLPNNADYFPVSITGAAKQPREQNINRYTVYTPFAAYYIAESDALDGCVRLSVDGNKNVKIKVELHNKSGKEIKTYIAAYMNLYLRHGSTQDIETKWYKSCRADADGFTFFTGEYPNRNVRMQHYAKIRRDYGGKVSGTTSSSGFKGAQSNQLYASESLFEGKIRREKTYTEFTENAIAADMLPLELKACESVAVTYTISIADDEKTVAVAAAKAEKKIENVYADIPALKIATDGSINETALTYFLHNVLRQTEFCSRAKNYAGELIGIRDIFQQLECALLWIPDYCRGKIIEALGFIGEDGRAPRQYTYPRSKDVPPKMDLRKFIDQGVWIISTVYTYLAVTGDFSILNETCGYYKLSDDTVAYSDKRDSVLEHLIRIADFLISNLDEETDCLHALYGDWNDALDGLGKTDDKGKDYGTGVSVMATMQLYKNCNELTEILTYEKEYADKIKTYKATAARIEKGLRKYAIDENKDGDKKILHGWGDKRAYKVGGYCDNDGKSRDSATSNAFWVLSGMNEKQDMRAYILQAFDRLDSKYGIKTFEPYFEPNNDKVGRITRLPKGTAENAATYIHATLFAIWALYKLGEYTKAEEQLKKILPLPHDFISTTPFVMPNSYVYNEEKGFDGESMSDWFTGSGAVLGKVLFLEIFGLRPDLNGLTIAPAKSTLFRELKTVLHFKSGELEIFYKNMGAGKRKITVNGKTIQVESVVLQNAEIYKNRVVVEISD